MRICFIALIAGALADQIEPEVERVHHLTVINVPDLHGIEWPITINRGTEGQRYQGFLQIFLNTCAADEPTLTDSWKKIWLFECEDFDPSLDVFRDLAEKYTMLIFVGDASNLEVKNATVAGVDARVAEEIKKAVEDYGDIEVFVVEEEVRVLDCARLLILAGASTCLAPIWMFITCMWLHSITWNRADATALQRLLAIPPMLKVGVSCTGAVMWQLCPWETLASHAFVMGYMGMSTMYQTVMFGCMILLSKGYCITRETFTRAEAIGIVTSVTLVYIIVSAHYVDSNAVTPLLMMLYLVLGMYMEVTCLQNLRTLENQLQYIRANRILAFEESLVLKCRMFAVFSRVVAVHAVGQAVFLLLQVRLKSVFWHIPLSLLDLAVFCTIASEFRPRTAVVFFGPDSRAPGTHHVIPLYESASSKKSETTASTMLVTIVNPAHPDELASHPWNYVAVGIMRPSTVGCRSE
jgi:hypothetical protein